MPTAVAKKIANRYAGKCTECGNRVEAEAGFITKVNGAWTVQHDGECPEVVAAPAAVTDNVGQTCEPGVYVTPDGDIVKVQQNKAKTAVYALRWVEINGERLVDEDESRVHGEWEYCAGLIRDIKPNWKMTLDQAKAFILRYGQCVRCSRKLKAAESVERGIGPVCVKYFSGFGG